MSSAAASDLFGRVGLAKEFLVVLPEQGGSRSRRACRARCAVVKLRRRPDVKITRVAGKLLSGSKRESFYA